LKAVRLLREQPHLAANAAALWDRVLAGVPKQHNSQMDVVLALWKAGLIR
jgi:hypothetical protein